MFLLHFPPPLLLISVSSFSVFILHAFSAIEKLSWWKLLVQLRKLFKKCLSSQVERHQGAASMRRRAALWEDSSHSGLFPTPLKVEVKFVFSVNYLAHCRLSHISMNQWVSENKRGFPEMPTCSGSWWRKTCCFLGSWLEDGHFCYEECWRAEHFDGWPFSQYLTKLAKGGDSAPCELPISRHRGSTEEQEKEDFELQRDAQQTLDIDAEEISVKESLQLAGVSQKLFLEVK